MSQFAKLLSIFKVELFPIIHYYKQGFCNIYITFCSFLVSFPLPKAIPHKQNNNESLYSSLHNKMLHTGLPATEAGTNHKLRFYRSHLVEHQLKKNFLLQSTS